MFQSSFVAAEPQSVGTVSFIVCEICGKSVSRIEYDRHLRTHKEKRVEVCKICFKAFTNISNFKYHMAHHGNDRPWLCSECPKNYKTKIDLIQHQRVHDKARDPFRCSICSQFFKTRSNFNTHLRTHSVKGPQKCVDCDKIFVNLRSHIQMVHQKIRTHLCHVCDKAFGKKSGLDRHVVTVHQKMRFWACDLCEKSFGEKAQLQRHHKTHFKPAYQEPDPAQITDDQEVIDDAKKRMRCGICKKVVNSKAALKRHKLLIHERRRNLLCDFCPRMFGEKSNLRRHIEKSHNEEMKIDTEEPSIIQTRQSTAKEIFPCSTCDKVLSTKWGLTAHEETCLINQQKKLNEKLLDSNLPNVDTMEQVFLVSQDVESTEIKQEPPFLDDYCSDESVSKFVPEVLQSESAESIDLLIKDEPEEMIETSEVLLNPDCNELSDQLKQEDTSDKEDFSPVGDYESNVDEEDFQFTTNNPEVVLEDSEPEVQLLKRYKCKLCPRTFKAKRYFQSHYRTVHGKQTKALKCTVETCDETFIYRAQRLRHLRQVHPEVYEESDVETEVTDPITNTELIPDNECELCNTFFNTQDDLENHIDLQHVDDVEADETEQKVTCEVCVPNKVFKKVRYFLLHNQAVHSNEAFACPQCPRTFSFKSSLGRHIKGVHEDISRFTCVENGCDKKFRSSYELKQHQIGSHNKGDKLDRTCQICNKVFKKVKYLQIHQASVHNTEPQYTCPICNRSFSFQRSMDRHIKAIHEDRRDFTCPAEGCDKAFRSKYDVNEHYNNIHALVKKTRPLEEVTCDVCEKVCSSRKVLYSHKKMVHEGVKWGMNFECKLCHEKFESKYKKSKHWGQVHRNGKVKTRTCHLCNSDFLLFEEFKQHVESHVGCFFCLICGHNFSDESALFIHSESHRKIEEVLRQFVCDVCSHRLSTKAQLLIHMRKHFPGDYYMCDICGKSYKFIAPFLHHKMGHENRFDFPCSYCEKKFRVARDRMLHERVHTKERPYKCESCQKAFAHKANYVSHLKTHEAKAYDCKHCGLQNPTAAKLRQHEDQEHPEERPFRCCYCNKSFKVSHSLEAHKQKCSESLLNIDLKPQKFFNYYPAN